MDQFLSVVLEAKQMVIRSCMSVQALLQSVDSLTTLQIFASHRQQWFFSPSKVQASRSCFKGRHVGRYQRFFYEIRFYKRDAAFFFLLPFENYSGYELHKRAKSSGTSTDDTVSPSIVGTKKKKAARTFPEIPSEISLLNTDIMGQ
jgi:hypothetical protein